MLLITICSIVSAQTGAPATRTLRGGVETPADNAKALAARAAARIRALQLEADRLAAEARSVFGDLRKLEIDRAIKREALARIEAELAETTEAGEAAAAHVKDLEAARVAQIPGVASRLVEISKRGRGGYLQLLLASDDVRAFGRLSRGVAAVAELDRVRLETHRRTLAAYRTAAADFNRKRAAIAASRKEAAAARVALDAAVAARNRLIDDLDRRRDLTAQYVSELQSAQSAMERTLATAGTVSPASALPIRPVPRRPRVACDGPGGQRIRQGARRPFRHVDRPKWYRDRRARGHAGAGRARWQRSRMRRRSRASACW